jgi:hypothetical protein
VKYARDELFYYSRDENQFLRRRRAFAFVLYPDLVALRFKDAELPYQRIVLLQSAILALVEKLTDWLSTDAIRFEVLFVQEREKKPLAEESTLMKLLLREAMERGHAVVEHVPDAKHARDRLHRLAQQAQVHALSASSKPQESEPDELVLTEFGSDRFEYLLKRVRQGEDVFDAWAEQVKQILEEWI